MVRRQKIIFFIHEDAMQQNMTPSNDREKILIEKIRTLSPEKITQVVDFINFISQKDSERRLIQATNRLAEPTFKKVWNNSEDDIYDNL
jgi:hypothetical protein